MGLFVVWSTTLEVSTVSVLADVRPNKAMEGPIEGFGKPRMVRELRESGVDHCEDWCQVRLKPLAWNNCLNTFGFLTKSLWTISCTNYPGRQNLSPRTWACSFSIMNATRVACRVVETSVRHVLQTRVFACSYDLV